jgi:crotonobetainyl-CoA:carnitine CoA-transferase CaiB-like acyl-CoA transferase
MLPTPFNMNAARAMNVHPTALALALRNQQYQMARAAAVAAATAAVNRPAPVLSPAQAAAAAMMLNQQRATGGFRGMMPQMNPRMFTHTPQRPNLPPALQRQHHVVHHSGGIFVYLCFCLLVCLFQLFVCLFVCLFICRLLA